MNTYEERIDAAIYERNPVELAISHLRYEAVRVLPTRRFAAMNKLNAQGHRFDDLVDRLIEEGYGFLDEATE